MFVADELGRREVVVMAGRRNRLRERVEERLAKSNSCAFLTREFRDLAGERQISRVLLDLTQAGKLVRLGYGIYARAETSPLTGRPMLAARGGFNGAAREALTKLGVAWDVTEWEREYNEGSSTQVPVNPAVRLKRGRFSRELGYAGTRLHIER
jgi:hypothetical protein